MNLGGGAESEFDELAAELTDVFDAGVDQDLSEEGFTRLALRTFRFQCRENRVFGDLVRARGIDPDRIDRWQEIPLVPTRVFRHVPLFSAPLASAERVFRTSGTTGSGVRGTHYVRSLALYRAAALPVFAANVLPDGARLPVVALLPSPQAAADSSLSYMVEAVMATYGATGGGWFLDADDGLLTARFRTTLDAAVDDGSPVCLVATAFALVHLLEACGRDGWSVSLPEGSRLMETGGYKGRTRSLSRSELYGGVEDWLGIPSAAIVNEYGMTEMLSQLYRSPLRTGEKDLDHHGPPWVRTQVLDPITLRPVESGAGLLAHFDLANLGTVSSILTEDWGERRGGGICLLGRAPGAEPRGCSLAAEEVLSVARGLP